MCFVANIAAADSRLLGKVDVRGDRGWTKTTIQIKKGDTFTIVASGNVTSGRMTVGPDGATGTKALDDPEASLPLNGARPLALIGRIGDRDPFSIGARTTVVAVREGTLSLAVNDDQLGDNKGGYAVAVWSGKDAGTSETADDPFEGSTWRSCSGTVHNVSFAAGGVVQVDTSCKGRWKRDGEKVTWACAALSYETTIAGDEMKGASFATKSPKQRDSICLRRGSYITPTGKPPSKDATASVGQKARNSAQKTTVASAAPTVTRPRDDGNCPAGTHPYAGKCASCPSGTEWKGSGCRGPCPAGTTEWNDACWVCPDGMNWIGNGWCKRDCTGDEITWADGCYTCPDGTTWAGNGWCKRD